MKNRSESDVRNLSLEELTADLAELDLPARNSAEIWLESEGWRPGSTKRAGTELYPKYRTWQAAHPEAGELLGVRAWGKIMTARFKKGRTSGGYFYYVSRETDAEVSAKLATE